jgi:hypothetical protein
MNTERNVVTTSIIVGAGHRALTYASYAKACLEKLKRSCGSYQITPGNACKAGTVIQGINI